MKITPCLLLAAIFAATALRADTENDHALDDAFQADLAALLPNEAPPAPAPQLMTTTGSGSAEPVLMAAPSLVSQQGAWGSVIPWTPHVPVTAAVLPDGRRRFQSGLQSQSLSFPDFNGPFSAIAVGRL